MTHHWILDNGHGGIDENGVYTTCPWYDKTKPKSFNKMYVHPDGTTVFEGDFNRKIVDRIASKLSCLGINYTVLVPGSKDVSLKDRVTAINEHYQRDKRSVVVSIHGNAYDSNVRGLEIFTSKGQTKSDPIAEVFVIWIIGVSCS